MGIDYGTKRVGVAVADDENRIATPKGIFANDAKLLDVIVSLIYEEGVTDVVVGESHDESGRPNPIMKKIEAFTRALARCLPAIPIHFESEYMTTREAKEVQRNIEKIDASAAAIILQSYLDRT